MAFDSPTRERLQRMAGACRKLLIVEFEEQFQERFGIFPADGRALAIETLTQRDDATLAIAELLRRRISHWSAQERGADNKGSSADAVHRVLREQAFTVFNRFIALRMAEERGFIPETAGGVLKSSYERYRVLLDRMLDELSHDLGVFLNRSSPCALLFPREPALRALFDELNSTDIRPLWKEDEPLAGFASMTAAKQSGKPSNLSRITLSVAFGMR